jgi:hypothetical protein
MTDFDSMNGHEAQSNDAPRADSDDVAQAFRDDVAHRSGMMAPIVQA